MIVEITPNDLTLLNSPFFNTKIVASNFINNPFCHYIVYLNQEKQVLGYLYYSDIYERLEINQIEVDVFHRNCKIGTKLLEFLTENVDKAMSLEVRVNNHYAIRLYKKFGFQEVAIRKGYYQGIDGLLMERSVVK